MNPPTLSLEALVRPRELPSLVVGDTSPFIVGMDVGIGATSFVVVAIDAESGVITLVQK